MGGILRLALLISIVSLGFAYIAQYAFGLVPCELCIAQRVPYATVIAFSLFGIAKPAYYKPAVYLVIAAFLIGGAIATYHAAVEKHFIAGPAACTSSDSPSGLTTEELLKRIENAPIVACDQPQWEFHGITMAVMNAIWSFAVAAAIIVALKRERHAKIAG